MNSKPLGTLVAYLDARTNAVTDVAALSTLEIQSIAYRSSDVSPGCLFFCIPGIKADGHDFAFDAAERGAVALAVQRGLAIDVPQIRFSDTRLALALVSRSFYEDPSADLTISAVTGTNGKTTTTYLVDWICRYHLACSKGLSTEAAQEYTGLIGTVETRLGSIKHVSKYTTPESLDLQRLLAEMRDRGVSHVCMEASSHAITLKRIAGIRFAVAAFTNLTQDHLDFHKTMEEYFEAKAALFDSSLVDKRVICIDDQAGRQLLRRCQKNGFGVLTCGLSEDAQIRAEVQCFGENSTTISLFVFGEQFSLTYPLIGGFNVSNVLLAASIAYALGIPAFQIVEALARCPQIPGRLERVLAYGIEPQEKRQAPINVFVDYSHTPDSITKALKALNELKTNKTIIVFGCGGDRDATKRPLMGKAALDADYAVVTSDNPRTEDPMKIIEDILPGMTDGEGRFEVEPDRRRAIAKALARAEAGDLVLIAGKGHEDYQLVGDQVLSFDDRIVAAEELAVLIRNNHWNGVVECVVANEIAGETRIVSDAEFTSELKPAGGPSCI